MDSLHVFISDTIKVSNSITPNIGTSLFIVMKEFILVIVAIIGLIVAISGLKTWRKQLKGNTEYDLARRLLKAIYEFRESIRTVRDPLISANEVKESYRNAGIIFLGDNPISDDRRDIYVYQKRWQGVSEKNNNLAVELLEAEVLWGKDIRDLVNNFLRVTGELRLGLNLFLEIGIEGIRQEYSQEKEEEIIDLIYDKSDNLDEDSFSRKLATEIQEIEGYLKL